ncbi:MAG: hypothetical protein WA549_05640 [Thermoplasmata archaeon]
MPVIARRRRAYALAGVLALLALLLASGIPLVGWSSGPDPASSARLEPWSVVQPCNGTSEPAAFTGTTIVEGSAPPVPGVANIAFQLDYHIEQVFSPADGSTPTVTCIGEAASTQTNSIGSFDFSNLVPAPTCDATGCTNSSGPFGAVSLSVSNGAPAGYFVTTAIRGSAFSISFIAALNRAVIVPVTGINTSVNATLSFHAIAQSGSGSPSPAVLQYAWRLRGPHWNVENGNTSASIGVFPGTGAGSASLELWVNGTFNGSSVHAPKVVENLQATATEISGTTVQPYQVDTGMPVSFSIRAIGAAGFVYDASIEPGLDLAKLQIPCVASSSSGATVRISCTTTVTYPAPGVAQPDVTVSNGYSWVTRSTSSIAVANNLTLEVTPSSVEGYANTSVPIVVSVPNGVGTPPFGPTCFFDGVGGSYCQTTPGPSWTFTPNYSEDGNFSGRVSVADAAGENRSISFPVQIFSMLGTTLPTSASSNLSVGESSNLASAIRGGVAPFAYWWNDSDTSTPFASGVTWEDGPITASFVPVGEGNVAVTLTVRDQLGTVNSSTALFMVGAGTVARLSLTSSVPIPGVPAGAGLKIGWVALNRYGDLVPDFSPSANLQVLATAPLGLAHLWVNSTAAGPLGDTTPGTFYLPPAAWVDGQLNLTVAEAYVGNLSIELSLIGGSANSVSLQNDSVQWEVEPILSEVHLFDPQVFVAGSRTNSTLYRIADPFDNPVLGVTVDIRSIFQGTVSTVESIAFGNASATHVWVNYTGIGTTAGIVLVLSASGISLLSPIAVPAAATSAGGTPLSSVASEGVTVWMVVAIVASGLFVLLRFRWSSRRSPRDRTSSEATDDDLRRYAIGCSEVVERIRERGPLDCEGLALDWSGPFVPRRSEIEDWVAGLVADGTLRPTDGADATTRFALAPAPSDPEPTLRVDFDPQMLARAMARFEDSDCVELPGTSSEDEGSRD